MRKEKSSQPISPEEPEQPLQSDQLHTTESPPSPHTPEKKRSPKNRGNIRAGLAVIAGRSVGALSRRLHLGGGTSIVGVVAQRVYPDIVEHLATELEHGSIMVTGTNGKTTTSSFISAILRDGGLRVWQNREGSNLMRGVASSLIIRARPNGHLRRSGAAISIFEVDEAALPQLVQMIPPRVAVFTNLFRDQLDRYGEVDSVVGHWKRAIQLLPNDTILVLNADDPAIAQLGEAFSGKVLYYGITDFTLAQPEPQDEKRHQVVDTRSCPHCGNEYNYDVRFYSHMGHYHCPNCGDRRPNPTIQATNIQQESFDRYRIQVQIEDKTLPITVPLPGLYNIYNALAAITATHALHIDWEPITSGIEQSKPVFGRGERIQAEGKTMRLLLAKNPTGFNEVLRTLFTEEGSHHILFVLNDNIADGQDISWIWDVDFERMAQQTQTLVVTGTRALDLALRLRYAGIREQDMQIIPPAPLRAQKQRQPVRTRLRRNKKHKLAEIAATPSSTTATQHLYGLKNALDQALQQTPEGETLFIVPTYTGLLEVHHELEQRGLTPHYWEGRDA
ncbi:MAG TPA: MurT ligase domain-containing protein [Dictyobacter sp.]|jgi:UDP-N-acetylmuramyl tripeptide synthase|nr:MurT ligase domain-containing protein [Dictyobacter sp.]